MSSSISTISIYEDDSNFPKKDLGESLIEDLDTIEKKMENIRVTASKNCDRAAQKLKTLQQAFEDITRLNKRLILVRLETKLAEIDANIQQQAVEIDKVQKTNENFQCRDDYIARPSYWKFQTEVKRLQDVPEMKSIGDIFSFTERVADIVTELGKKDRAHLTNEVLTDVVFHKMKILETEFVKFAGRQQIEDPNLLVILEFLKEQVVINKLVQRMRI